MKQFFMIINSLLLLFRLLITTPKDAVYVFLFASNKPLLIKPYSKKSTLIARQIINEIQNLLPNTKVHFFGSAALQISGRGDIDLFIECTDDQFDSYVNVLKTKYGLPAEFSESNAEWRFTQAGFPVEIEIIVNSSVNLRDQKRVYELLTSKPKLLKEYEDLKMSMQGKPQKYYLLKRMDFFNRILNTTPFL